MRPYIAQIKSNLRLMGRDRTVLFFNYLFPLVFFFLFAQLYDGGKSPAAMAQVIAMVLIIGVLGSGFFGAGMRAVQDRESNVLRRFKVAPISAAPIIVASLVSGLVSFIPTVLLFLFFARVIYHMPVPANVISLLIFICLGAACFRSVGMIVAAVVNSSQESQVLIQLLYLPMLFLSGATFPISIMPLWVQTVAQFLPATYLFQGTQAILIGGESVVRNWPSVLGLAITMTVAVFIGVKLFRWEKEEKIKNSAKLWILAVLAPFILLGVYQASSKQNIEKSRVLERSLRRNRAILFQNAKIIVGTGKVIPRGALLMRNGKIAQVFDTPPADTKALQAEVVDSSGKTLMPGLIDMHVHIGAPGGIYEDKAKYADQSLTRRRLASYLYSGITAVRSVGDWLDVSLKLREAINSGSYLGAEFFAYGPLFTTEGGHGTEYFKDLPSNMKGMWEKQFVRLPKSAQEAKSQVDDLKHDGVDGIKAVLESGTAGFGLFNHMDAGIYRAVVQQAIADRLPVATHTGNSADVRDAVEAGTSSVEHGSMTDLIPPDVFAAMKAKGIAYDPTLAVFEGVTDFGSGKTDLLDRSLVQQVGPADLVASTRSALQKQQLTNKQNGQVRDPKAFLDRLNTNLMAAYHAGVMLIAGTDAGNLLVIHGPTVHRELQLWVKAGISNADALQAATYSAAKILRAEDRIGSLQAGREATMLLLDGDPLQDIANTERIAQVVFRGERINRSDLFDQDPK